MTPLWWLESFPTGSPLLLLPICPAMVSLGPLSPFCTYRVSTLTGLSTPPPPLLTITPKNFLALAPLRGRSPQTHNTFTQEYTGSPRTPSTITPKPRLWQLSSQMPSIPSLPTWENIHQVLGSLMDAQCLISFHSSSEFPSQHTLIFITTFFCLSTD